MNGTRRLKLVGLLGAGLALSGCERGQPPAEPAPTASAEPKSIFRPEFRPEPVEKALEPLRATILFPQGAELNEDALAGLEAVLRSPQIARGGEVVLGGHSDAGGNDEINLRISRARAEAVRDWLVEAGVAEERIEVIAFGEQNPVEPNALPDGAANEAGRAANRRVDITVEVAASATKAAASGDEPTLAESLAEPEGDAADASKPERD